MDEEGLLKKRIKVILKEADEYGEALADEFGGSPKYEFEEEGLAILDEAAKEFPKPETSLGTKADALAYVIDVNFWFERWFGLREEAKR